MRVDVIIPVLLGAAVILSLLTALRLIFWARAPQNIAGSFLLTVMACNLMGYLGQLLNNDIQVMLSWEKFQVIGLNLVYPALLIFILYFTGQREKVTIRLALFLACLSALPIVTFLLPSTNSWFVNTLGIDSFGSLHTLRQEVGWVVWVSTAIAQVESFIGIVILFRFRRRVRPDYQFHMFTLYISQGFAFVSIWMQNSGFNPVDPISIFNLSFIPTCIAVSWAIYGLRIGQTLPAMRERVVETMLDGVIVLDGQNYAAYLNPAAYQIFQLSSRRLNNPSLDHLAPKLSDHLAANPSTVMSDETVEIGAMIYSLRRSVIEDWKGDLVGQVLVLRNVTDRERLEQALQSRAAELSRSNSFTQSLSLLASRIAASGDLDQVYDTLRDELHRIDLEFCVGLRTNGQRGYALAYLSLDNPIIHQLEKSLGMKAIGFRLPELGELSGLDQIDEGGAIFVPRIMDSVRLVFDQFPKNFEQILLKTTGVSLQISSLTFRLNAQNEDIGMLAIWGPSLRREDLAPLSTFSAQVSAAIQKSRLIKNEQIRISELERTNRLILSLTQVAAQFEANLNLEQILDILGGELRKLGATCVVAFTDPNTDELVGRYTSCIPSLWGALEKITGFTLEDFRIPYKDWQALDPDATGPARIIHDPVGYVDTIFGRLPRPMIKRVLKMLGMTPQSPPVWLPLRANGRNIGILAVWGIYEPDRYLTVFSLFARQVATAIEKARLMTDLVGLKSFNEGIVQGAAEAILMFDPAGQITFANPAAEKLFGMQTQDLIGKEWGIFISPDQREKVGAWLYSPQAKNAVGVEFNLVHQDGHKLPVLINIQTLYKEGQPDSILVSLMDIQQRMEAEQQIRASIEEKEALLKEIHHRVKNNLQIVSSLLNLQAGRFNDPYMVEAFRESQNRVRSMALIHEKLYRSNNLARIRFDEYIKELGQFLMRTYNDPARRIQLEVKADAVNLDIDSAIPCGLIINELVTNSIKHGFPITQNSPSSKSAQITINLALLSEHQIQINIADNGIGFPEDRDYQNMGSLGLQLVTSLTHQLGGEVAFKTNQGAQTEIIFTNESAYLG